MPGESVAAVESRGIMKFRVALLQVSPFGNDQGRNLAKGLQYCRDSKALGADLAVFPELWNIGLAPCPIDAAGRESNWQGDVVLNYSKVFICDYEIGCDVNCSPGESFNVCTLSGAEGEVRVGAMICADREFPEPATELMLNGAELMVVPNACTWDDIRRAGVKTRAFESLAGMAVANHPAPLNNGHSQAYTCVAWKDGKPRQTLMANAGEQEEVLVASFDLDEIRAFRIAESWRMERLRQRARKTHAPTS